MAAVIGALVRLLLMLGVAWFGWKLEKQGGFDALARAATGTANVVGDVTGAPGKGAGSPLESRVLIIGVGVLAIVLLSRGR